MKYLMLHTLLKYCTKEADEIAECEFFFPLTVTYCHCHCLYFFSSNKLKKTNTGHVKMSFL